MKALSVRNLNADNKEKTMLEVGKPAPDFTLPASDGTTKSLSDYKGKKLVLYFYPKDNTSGCTTEACDFRDNLARVQSLGAEVVGVSPDSLPSHEKFLSKYELPFVLLSDESKEMLEAFDIWREKTRCGRTSMGVVRTTILLDEKGIVRKIFDNVKVKGHVDEEIGRAHV